VRASEVFSGRRKLERQSKCLRRRRRRFESVSTNELLDIVGFSKIDPMQSEKLHILRLRLRSSALYISITTR